MFTVSKWVHDLCRPAPRAAASPLPPYRNLGKALSLSIFTALLIGMAGSARIAGASTPLNGPISVDTTLTAANSPYIVNSAIGFIGGATLTIQAGVEVRFAKGTYFEVNSGTKLIVNGAADSLVRLTADQTDPRSGDWRGTWVHGGGMASFTYCDIGFAGNLNEHALKIETPDVTLSHVTIHDSAGVGIRVAGGQNPAFDNLTITHCDQAAVYLEDFNSTPSWGTNLKLQNNRPDGVVMGGGAINRDTTYTLVGYPYYPTSAIGTVNGATVTFNPGVEVRWPGGSYLEINGGTQLNAVGTASSHVKFTSAAETPAAGAWRGTWVHGGAKANFNYCDIQYAGNVNEHALSIQTSEVQVLNTTIRDSAGPGIRVAGGQNPTFDHLSISNSAQAAILLEDVTATPAYGANLTLQNNHPDGVVLGGGAINRDTTYTLVGYPYYPSGAIGTLNSATLTLNPGVDIRWPAGAYLEINGKTHLKAQGTPTQRIRLTSAQTPQAAGNWRGVWVHGEATADLAFCDVEFAGGPNEHAMKIETSDVTLQSVTIHDSLSTGLRLSNNVSPTFNQLSISKCAGAAILLEGAIATPDYGTGLTLKECSPNGVVVVASAISRSVTYPLSGYPYYIAGAIGLNGNSVLTLLPGVDLRFSAGAYLDINGSTGLVAEGAPGRLIRMSPWNDAPQAGQWRGIWVHGGAQARFAFCDIAYGGGTNEQAIKIETSAVRIAETTIHDSNAAGLRLSGSISPTFDTLAITNCNGPAFVFENSMTAPDFGTGLTMQNNRPDGVIMGASAINQDTTWNLVGYPYYPTGAIGTSGNTTLSISPGVEVRWPGGSYLEINGGTRLEAAGAPGRPITFMSAQVPPRASDWRGFFIHGGAGARFSYCDIAHTGSNGEGALTIETSDVVIRHNHFHDNASDAVRVRNNAAVVMTGNSIEHNTFGVRTETPNTFVNAVLNWWGDPNGPKSTRNPLVTIGDSAGDGVLFQPWIGNAAEAGTAATGDAAAAFVPWPLFSSDDTQVTPDGSAFAVWSQVLPQQGKGDPTFFQLPFDFGGVQFSLDWKAGKHATLAGDGAATQQFCVDGQWQVKITGPTPKTLSGTGCHDPIDLANEGLADGVYGVQLLLTSPVGAKTYGVSNIYLLSDGFNFREKVLSQAGRALHFALAPADIPVGTVGTVEAKLVSTPKPFSGMITHFGLDPRAILIEGFGVPSGWSGTGGGSTQGTFYESSGVGPLKVGQTAFSMNVRCLKAGKWPISFEGNGFGLGPTADPNQSLNYLTAVSDVMTLSCVDPAPAAGLTPGGVAVDPADASLFVTVNGTGFGAATKAILTNGAGETVSTSTGVTPSGNGASLTAHFPKTPAGTYGYKATDAGGAVLGASATTGIDVPPAIPLFTVEQTDVIPQLPGKAVTHFWSLENHGSVDGVAVVTFGFPSYMNPEPKLVTDALPEGSRLLVHEASDYGWIENVAVPVKAGGFVNVPWTYVVPPDVVFGANPLINGGDTLNIYAIVSGSVNNAQWLAITGQAGIAADAIQQQANSAWNTDMAFALGGLKGLDTAGVMDYAFRLRATYGDLVTTLFDSGYYSRYQTLASLGGGSGTLSRLRSKGGPGPLQASSAASALFTLRNMIQHVKCGKNSAAATDALDLVVGEIADRAVSPVLGYLSLAKSTGMFAAEQVNNAVIESGFNSYENARSNYMTQMGLDPTQQFPPEKFHDFVSYLNDLSASTQATQLMTAIASLYGPDVNRIQLTDKQIMDGLNQMEVIHFLKIAMDEKAKNQSTWDSLKSKWNHLMGGTPVLPTANPCPDKQTRIVFGYDPNDIEATPAGVPDKNWFAGAPPMRYMIHFENLPAALAAAEDVRVELKLDPSLDPASVKLDGSSMANVQFAFDPGSRTLTWMLPGINLPPNAAPPRGEGWVAFTATPKTQLTTGSAIKAKGQVFFDFNPPIVTPEIIRTADNTRPVSHVQPLPQTVTVDNFPVQWTGTDEGSGIGTYDVYVSEDGKPFALWLNQTTASSGVYHGVNGRSYAFFSVATDKVGNSESPAGTAQATTKLSIGIGGKPGDVNGDTKVTVQDVILVLQYTAKLITLSPQQIAAGDVTGDGKVNIADAVRILRMVAGLP